MKFKEETVLFPARNCSRQWKIPLTAQYLSCWQVIFYFDTSVFETYLKLETILLFYIEIGLKYILIA